VIRRGKATPEEVDLVREKLATPKIIAQKVDADILVLRIPSLDAGRAMKFAIVSSTWKTGHSQGHPGCAGMRPRTGLRGNFDPRLFVPSGILTTLRGQNGFGTGFFSRAKTGHWKNPVSVLIDATTSGAAKFWPLPSLPTIAEMSLASALFGLASEQKLISLDDGAALILTSRTTTTPAANRSWKKASSQPKVGTRRPGR